MRPSVPGMDRLGGWLRRGRGEASAIAAAGGVTSFGSLVVAIVSARLLGPGGRGEVVLVLTVCILCMRFVNLGANTSGRIGILRGAPPGIDAYLGMSWVLTAVQVVVVATVLLLSRISGGGLSTGTIVVGVVLGGCMFSGHMLVDACHAVRRSLDVAVRAVVIGVVPLVLVLVAPLVVDLSVELVLGILAVGHLCGIIHLALVVGPRSGRPRYGIGDWWPFVRRGFPLLSGSFSEAVAYRADRLLIGVLLTASALGVYSVAATAVELPRLLATPASAVLANRIASGQVAAGSIRRASLQILGAYLAALLLVGFFGATLVVAVLGEQFAGIRSPLAVLVIGEAAFGAYLVGVGVLTGLERYRSVAVPSLVGSFVLVAGGFWAIQQWGLQGAAWARVVAFGVMALGAWSAAARAIRSAGDDS